jgi:hypothetical protein
MPRDDSERNADLAAHAEAIRALGKQMVANVIEIGHRLTICKEALGHGNWLPWLEREFGWAEQSARNFMAVHAMSLKSPTVGDLNLDMRSLYLLAAPSTPAEVRDEILDRAKREKVSHTEVKRAVTEARPTPTRTPAPAPAASKRTSPASAPAPDADGLEIPDSEIAKTVVNGARAIMASRTEPDESLDYFPTPPWATRALFEWALPASARSIASVWEPACGEGHIAEVLREYVPTVTATDIHNYGYGDRLVDFLDPHGVVPENRDWIITNPPFDDAAVKFVLRALDLAETGVAMFFRSQWAVEGINRYETIFRDRPPTRCAFFVERVNLCKGRWDPDGSTATAYCWLIWIKGQMPQPTFWIPPGCRDDLIESDDVERFTAHPVVKKRCKNSGPCSTRPPIDEPDDDISLLGPTEPVAAVVKAANEGMPDIPPFLRRTKPVPAEDIAELEEAAP